MSLEDDEKELDEALKIASNAYDKTANLEINKEEQEEIQNIFEGLANTEEIEGIEGIEENKEILSINDIFDMADINDELKETNFEDMGSIEDMLAKAIEGYEQDADNDDDLSLSEDDLNFLQDGQKKEVINEAKEKEFLNYIAKLKERKEEGGLLKKKKRKMLQCRILTILTIIVLIILCAITVQIMNKQIYKLKHGDLKKIFIEQKEDKTTNLDYIYVSKSALLIMKNYL